MFESIFGCFSHLYNLLFVLLNDVILPLDFGLVVILDLYLVFFELEDFTWFFLELFFETSDLLFRIC